MSDGKLEFLLKLADWVEEWSKSPMFIFTSQTTKALMTTLRATAALAYDQLNEGYEYVLTSCLSADSLEVSATVSAYIAKKINEKVQCDACTPHSISTDNAENINNEYLLLISRGGLTVPTNIMANFVVHAFSALSISEKTIQKYPFITARNAAKHVLNEYLDSYCLSCIDHADIVKRVAAQCIINIYNNKQKAEGDIPRKDNLKAFKKRQRCSRDESCS